MLFFPNIVKAKIDKELKDLDQKETDNEKGECCICGKIRVLEEENGLCKNCFENYDGTKNNV